MSAFDQINVTINVTFSHKLALKYFNCSKQEYNQF